MKLETFFDKFGELAEAPNGVAKMRELVLRMATSGRIAEQCTADPPASELLQEIAAIRDTLIRRGSAKSRIEGNPILAGDTIVLPQSWKRCMISEVCDLQTGATPSRQERRYFGGNIPWLVSGDINRGEITECDGRITEEGLEGSNCKIIPANSVLIALNGQGKTRATVAILRIPAALNQSLVAMVPFSNERLLPEYIFWNLRGRYYAIRDITGQDQRRGLNMKLVGQLSLPIPPLAEQKRIVAKVDELMALCDRLEAQQQERETQHVVLARASLARFAGAPTSDNLRYLFHHSYSVSPADLRKVILTLAVQGKLVPQNPKDESAEELYEKLAIERRHFANVHKFRALGGDPVDGSSTPFSIPTTWRWCRLSSMFNAVTDGDHLPPPKSDDGVAFLTIGNITTGTLDFENSRFVPDSYYQGLADFRRPVRGDILYTVVGATYGRPALVQTDRPFCVQRHIAILKPPRNMDVGFLMVVLRSPLAYQQATASTTGTAQPTIPLGSLRNFMAPLPPLAEQRRIAAQVDHLLALVDELENQLAAYHTTAAELLSAIVAELSR